VLSNKFGVGNSMFRIGSEKTIKVDTVPFGIYSKDIFYSIGLYNEKLLRNQDMEFSKRLSLAKKEIYLVPAAKCYYYARETFIQLAKNNFGNGMWVPLTVYITKKTSSLSLRHFIPLIFILSIVLPILLIIVLPKLFFVSVLSFFAYLILILVMSYKLYDKSTSYLQLIAAFFVLHFSYGFGSLVGLFRINYLWK
jgi:GT2 family glycosyltransferase